jgi:transposase
LNKIEELKKSYDIEKVVFVGDRGMVTQANYKQISHETVKVISALTHATIKSLCENKTIQLELFDERDIVEIIDGGKRYCLCKNPDMAAKEAATRKVLLKKTTDELDKIVASTRKTKYSKEIRVGKIINQYKMGKFIVFHGEGERLTYTLDEAKIEQESRLDGCYVIYTDVSADDLTAVETVESYKSLMQVEQAFRNMKTVQLEIRPIFHKTDDRIRCHVFICMLAYYVMWHMKQRLRPLVDSDGAGARRKYSFDYIMESLKSIRKETVEFCNGKSSVITVLTAEQNRILQLLGIKF